ncbi:MAG: hypothetical protein NTV00_00005, partial [Methylococcales bacterium]|nr:hypothetical protein [Methylococcales bacterium]
MIFDENSRTLTGTPPANAVMPLNLKVTASDGSATVDDTFTLTLDPLASGSGTPTNVAPSSTNDSVTILQNTTTALALTDFGNYDDAEGAAIAAVQITSLPAHGTLQYNGGNVILNQSIPAVDITSGNLQFVPAAGAFGNNYADIGFKVGDGVAFSSNAYTLSVDVTQTTSSPTPVTFAASTITTSAASAFTHVYSSDPLTGFAPNTVNGEVVKVVVDATGGTIRFDSGSIGGATLITLGYGDPINGSATSLAFQGTLAEVNAALQHLEASRGINPSVSLSLNAVTSSASSAYNVANQHYYEIGTFTGGI